MAKINGLDKMSYTELSELRARVDAAMIAAKAAEKLALRSKIEELAAASGMSLEDVLGTKRGRKAGGAKGSAAAVKYRNPKDDTQTWAGRGRKPTWLVTALKKGQKIESFEV